MADTWKKLKGNIRKLHDQLAKPCNSLHNVQVPHKVHLWKVQNQLATPYLLHLPELFQVFKAVKAIQVAKVFKPVRILNPVKVFKLVKILKLLEFTPEIWYIGLVSR